MLRTKKIWKGLGYFVAFILLLLLAVVIYVVIVSDVSNPKPANTQALSLQRTEQSPGFYTIKNSWFRKSNSGLFELYAEGMPFEMGVINGKLTKELVVRQEDHFNEQISKMIPSQSYRNFLKYFIGWFNRHLDKNVTEEYKEEIYGI